MTDDTDTIVKQHYTIRKVNTSRFVIADEYHCNYCPYYTDEFMALAEHINTRCEFKQKRYTLGFRKERKDL